MNLAKWIEFTNREDRKSSCLLHTQTKDILEPFCKGRDCPQCINGYHSEEDAIRGVEIVESLWKLEL